MVIALNPDSEVRYVLTADRELPEEQQTVFRLRHLTVRQRAELYKVLAVAERDKDERKFVDAIVDAAHAALAGWENLCDADGKNVRCRMDRGAILGSTGSFVAESALKALPFDAVQELGQHVIEAMLSMSEDDRGK